MFSLIVEEEERIIDFELADGIEAAAEDGVDDAALSRLSLLLVVKVVIVVVDEEVAAAEA